MDNHRLNKLLKKYLSNSCTQSEYEELLEQFKRAENEPELKALLSDFWERHVDESDVLEFLVKDDDAWFDEIYSQAMNREGRHLLRNRTNIRRHSHRSGGQWFKVAALILISLLMSLFYFTMSQEEALQEVVYEQKAPGPGEKMRFTLPDGTQVNLNSDSFIEYNASFDEEVREVYLKGEAYFVVARDEARPFIVKTKKVNTQVLGTTFNIRAYPEDDQVLVAVASGKVGVSDATSLENQVILEANEWANYHFESQNFSTGSGNISMFTAWNEGVLLYHDKSLEDVATQLERWYGVQISFANEQLKECIIRGEHRDETLVNVLNAIGYAFDLEYHIEGRQVALDGRGCK